MDTMHDCFSIRIFSASFTNTIYHNIITVSAIGLFHFVVAPEKLAHKY